MSLQNLSSVSGLPQNSFPDHASSHGAWKLHYYQWAMQIFEHYKMSASACHIAVLPLNKLMKFWASLNHPSLLKDDFGLMYSNLHLI
ncbi:hypothetical protein HanPI659440_Chr05g0183741 [Helianthus annuus]|nr:hypothetical protein HanPI659440_Chr05g0183741 [Helianthus annuus]